MSSVQDITDTSLLFVPGTTMIGEEGAGFRYYKHEADTVKAFAHVLASEPDGGKLVRQWVKEVFTTPLRVFYGERCVQPGCSDS